MEGILVRLRRKRLAMYNIVVPLHRSIINPHQSLKGRKTQAMAPVTSFSGFVFSHRLYLVGSVLFFSVLSIVSAVAVFCLGVYEDHCVAKTSDNVDVDVEPGSSSVFTIPIPELPLSADWVVFEHDGKTYRYTKYQAQALLSIILTSTTPDLPTETIEDNTSLPSLDSDEESDESSDDNLDIYGLSPSLSVTDLNMCLLSGRSCYATRYTSRSPSRYPSGNEDYSTPDKVMQSNLGSLGSSVQRTRSDSW
ncbi:hypothetical protein NLI96_g4925 [Meripilus lineatus]|uniref:Transmembrane protein n=1 Tax=Meripilus lineatus TaxID=2056292 RepID=A0AAD5V3Q4_9APHY|nr:hypothetical protein NLI96_g4925 [Physisporinus lineatus]